MNHLLGGGKNQGGLSDLASQLLGSGHHNHTSGGGSATDIVGALTSQLLGGGKKPDYQQQMYPGSQNSQQNQGAGLMGTLSEMFGGHHSTGGSVRGIRNIFQNAH